MLRPEVHFHNGAPLTSAEVRWTFQHYLDPATHWRCDADVGRGGATPIVGVDTPDAHTVVIHLGKPAPLFLQTITRAECGNTGILHPASVGPDGKFRAPIGTGPFMFGSWKRNQYIQLLRFPQYSSLPAFERISGASACAQHLAGHSGRPAVNSVRRLPN